MNNSKAGSYGRLIAFFLVAIILLCAFGFAVEGWQPANQRDPNTITPGTDDTDKNDNKDTSGDTPIQPEEPKIPDYTDPITGLEIAEADSRIRYIAFVIDSSAPLYGISASNMIIEIPTEKSSTRLMAFMRQGDVCAKLGSIAPTRAYISSLSKYFGAALVAYGSDDTVLYNGCDITGSYFDMAKNSGHSYSEYESFNYTNSDLIAAGLAKSGISMIATSQSSIPYRFAAFNTTASLGSISAKTVSLPFNASTSTDFYYSVTHDAYLMSKNGTSVTDPLSSDALKFSNVFVLFADSVTYENENGSELVMNTTGGGKGIYINSGTAKSITWSADPLGNMTFYDEFGAQLTVNRGNVYVGFMKSADSSAVKIS